MSDKKPFKKHYIPATPSKLPVISVDEDLPVAGFNVEYHVTEDALIPLPDPNNGFVGDRVTVVQIRGEATITWGGTNFTIPKGSDDGDYAPRAIYTVVELDGSKTWISEVVTGNSETYLTFDMSPTASQVDRTITDSMIEKGTDIFIMLNDDGGTAGEVRLELTEASLGKRFTFTRSSSNDWIVRGSSDGLTYQNHIKALGSTANAAYVRNDDPLGVWSSVSMVVLRDANGDIVLSLTSIIGRWVRPNGDLIKPSYFYQ